MPVQFGKRHRGEPGHTQFGTGTATGSGTHVGRCGLAAGFFQGTDISRLCDVTVGVSRSYKGRGRPRLQ